MSAAIEVLLDAGRKPIAPGEWVQPGGGVTQQLDRNQYDIEQVIDQVARHLHNRNGPALEAT